MRKYALTGSVTMTLLLSLVAASQTIAPVYGQVGQVPTTDLKCYPSETTPSINPGPVELTDQFGTETVTALQNFPFSVLCQSAVKNDEGTLEELHWKVYLIVDGTIAPGVVTVTDQFGTRDMDLGTGIFLLVPALKIIEGDLQNNDGIVSPVHWKCYSVVGEDPIIDPPIVKLLDQFITENVDPGTAEDFCTPVIKTVQGVSSGTLDAPHLVCYAITGDFNPPIVTLLDQFGEEQVDLSFADLMYTLATKGAIVGGEILPIDMTSLLVAGAFTNAYWILPILGAIGSVIVVVTTWRKP